MKSFLIFFGLFLIAAITPEATCAKTNYCQMACRDIDTNKVIRHIGCNHNNLFDRYHCPRNARIVKMTKSLKNLFLHLFNTKRNSVAGGYSRNLAPACRMATMKWSNELANLAVLNVKQCRSRHDKCHNTRAFRFSGQNIYEAWKVPAGNFNDKLMLTKAVENWYEEGKYCSQSIMNEFPARYYGPKIGHFTVMMAENNTHVGCGVSTYTRGNKSFYLVTCNFAVNNMLNEPIYTACQSPGTSCASRNCKWYTNLCN